MELEIKHLAPYLPHGLKFEINIFDQALVIGEMVGLNNKEIEFSGIRKTITESFTYDLCLPRLRPLSSLTKEIEHNGERFVPNLHKEFKYFVDFELDYFVESIPNSLNYTQLQLLLEWHFDIFNLIPNNLAISIND